MKRRINLTNEIMEFYDKEMIKRISEEVEDELKNGIPPELEQHAIKLMKLAKQRRASQENEMKKGIHENPKVVSIDASRSKEQVMDSVRPAFFKVIREAGILGLTNFSENIQELGEVFRAEYTLRSIAYRKQTINNSDQVSKAEKILASHDATDLSWMVLEGPKVDKEMSDNQGIYFQLAFLDDNGMNQEPIVNATLNGKTIEVDEVDTGGNLLVVHLVNKTGFSEKLESRITWGRDNPLDLIIELYNIN